MTERRAVFEEQIRELRKELRQHTEEEMPAIRVMLQELGTPEQVRERRIFVELFIVKEQERAKLRTAIIEKGLLVAIVALLAFMGQAVWHELAAAFKMMLGVK